MYQRVFLFALATYPPYTPVALTNAAVIFITSAIALLLNGVVSFLLSHQQCNGVASSTNELSTQECTYYI